MYMYVVIAMVLTLDLDAGQHVELFDEHSVSGGFELDVDLGHSVEVLVDHYFLALSRGLVQVRLLDNGNKG
jgi:hypothetical protein